MVSGTKGRLCSLVQYVTQAKTKKKGLLNKLCTVDLQLSIGCTWFQLDEEKEKEKDERFMEQIELELEEFEDEFIKEYRNKRIEEMRRAMDSV